MPSFVESFLRIIEIEFCRACHEEPRRLLGEIIKLSELLKKISFLNSDNRNCIKNYAALTDQIQKEFSQPPCYFVTEVISILRLFDKVAIRIDLDDFAQDNNDRKMVTFKFLTGKNTYSFSNLIDFSPKQYI